MHMATPIIPLDESERTEIMQMYGRLERVTYFELLGVDPSADVDEVRSQYRLLSRSWHPDAPRWRQRDLSSFDRAIRAIFEQIRTAERTLSDPERRAEYARAYGKMTVDLDAPSVPRESKPRPASSPGATPASMKDSTEQRRPVQRRRSRTRTPTAKGPRSSSRPISRPDFAATDVLHASDAVERARALERTGDLSGAQRQLEVACALAPEREDIAEKAEDLARRVVHEIVDPLLARARRAVRLEKWDVALEQLDRVLRIDADHTAALQNSAYCLVQLRRDSDESVRRAYKATQLEADDAQSQYVLALAYRADGKRRAARAACERALELEPDHGEAAKLLRRLKRWF